MVKSPPSNAGDSGSIPVWGTRIPHAAGQLSPRATMKSPRVATKTRLSQINIKKRKKEEKETDPAQNKECQPICLFRANTVDSLEERPRQWAAVVGALPSHHWS